MDEREEEKRLERIRQRAHRLWEEEGRPQGREEIHWDMATELVAIEDNQRFVTEPVPTSGLVGPTGEPVEPLAAVENVGEFPTIRDQGEEQPFPSPLRGQPVTDDIAAEGSGTPRPRAAKPAKSTDAKPASGTPAKTAAAKASPGAKASLGGKASSGGDTAAAPKTSSRPRKPKDTPARPTR